LPGIFVEPDVILRFLTAVGRGDCEQGYGMTEAGPVLSMCPAFAKEPSPAKPGSCGTVVRNAELKVVDPDTGLSLGRNLPGEICIRGPQIMKGRCELHVPLAQFRRAAVGHQ